MKSIILFRHCKTESLYLGRDHDRPLTSTGISDAREMGLYLAEKNEVPDLMISSTAIRAKTTAETAMAEGKWDCNFEINTGIYGGDSLYLLKLSKKQNNSISLICLVGHEPHFSNFLARSTTNTYQHFSKGSMARIDFDIEKWVDISLGHGKLIWQVEPM